jgi:hypothetical protein
MFYEADGDGVMRKEALVIQDGSPMIAPPAPRMPNSIERCDVIILWGEKRRQEEEAETMRVNPFMRC